MRKGEPGARIRDSNSDLVAATLRGIGQMVTDHRRVRDDRAEASRIIAEMAAGLRGAARLRRRQRGRP